MSVSASVDDELTVSAAKEILLLLLEQPEHDGLDVLMEELPDLIKQTRSLFLDEPFLHQQDWNEACMLALCTAVISTFGVLPSLVIRSESVLSQLFLSQEAVDRLQYWRSSDMLDLVTILQRNNRFKRSRASTANPRSTHQWSAPFVCILTHMACQLLHKDHVVEWEAVQSSVKQWLRRSFPHLLWHDINAGFALFTLDVLDSATALEPAVASGIILKGIQPRLVVQLLQQHDVIPFLESASGLPRHHLVAHFAEILFQYATDYQSDDGLAETNQACEKLIRFGFTHNVEFLLKELTQGSAGASASELAGSKKRKRKAEDDSPDQVTRRGRIMSAGYPFVVHVRIMVMNDQHFQAQHLARQLEECPVLAEHEKVLAWSLVLDHLMYAGQIFLDGNNMDSAAYQEKRTKILLMRAHMGNLGLDVLVDFFKKIIEEVSNDPYTTQEEIRYVTLASQHTVLRILMDKWNIYRGVEKFLEEFPSLYAVGNLQSWAVRFLMQGNPIPASLLVNGEFDLNPMWDRAKEQERIAEAKRNLQILEQSVQLEQQKSPAKLAENEVIEIDDSSDDDAATESDEDVDISSLEDVNDDYDEIPDETQNLLERGDETADEDNMISLFDSDGGEVEGRLKQVDDEIYEDNEESNEVIYEDHEKSSDHDETYEDLDETYEEQGANYGDAEDHSVVDDDEISCGDEVVAEEIDESESDEDEGHIGSMGVEDDGVTEDNAQNDVFSDDGDDGDEVIDQDLEEEDHNEHMEKGYEPDTTGHTEEEVSEAVNTEDEDDEENQPMAEMRRVRELRASKQVGRPMAVHPSFSDMDAADERTEPFEDAGAESSELDESAVIVQQNRMTTGLETEASTTLAELAFAIQRHMTAASCQENPPDSTDINDAQSKDDMSVEVAPSDAEHNLSEADMEESSEQVIDQVPPVDDVQVEGNRTDGTVARSEAEEYLSESSTGILSKQGDAVNLETAFKVVNEVPVVDYALGDDHSSAARAASEAENYLSEYITEEVSQQGEIVHTKPHGTREQYDTDVHDRPPVRNIIAKGARISLERQLGDTPAKADRAGYDADIEEKVPAKKTVVIDVTPHREVQRAGYDADIEEKSAIDEKEQSQGYDNDDDHCQVVGGVDSVQPENHTSGPAEQRIDKEIPFSGANAIENSIECEVSTANNNTGRGEGGNVQITHESVPPMEMKEPSAFQTLSKPIRDDIEGPQNVSFFIQPADLNDTAMAVGGYDADIEEKSVIEGNEESQAEKMDDDQCDLVGGVECTSPLGNGPDSDEKMTDEEMQLSPSHESGSSMIECEVEPDGEDTRQVEDSMMVKPADDAAPTGMEESCDEDHMALAEGYMPTGSEAASSRNSSLLVDPTADGDGHMSATQIEGDEDKHDLSEGINLNVPVEVCEGEEEAMHDSPEIPDHTKQETSGQMHDIGDDKIGTNELLPPPEIDGQQWLIAIEAKGNLHVSASHEATPSKHTHTDDAYLDDESKTSMPLTQSLHSNVEGVGEVEAKKHENVAQVDSPLSNKEMSAASADDESKTSSQGSRARSKVIEVEANLQGWGSQEFTLTRHTRRHGVSTDDESKESSQGSRPALLVSMVKGTAVEASMPTSAPQLDLPSRLTYTNDASADDESLASSQMSGARFSRYKSKVIEVEPNLQVWGPQEDSPSGHGHSHDAFDDDKSKASSQGSRARSFRVIEEESNLNLHEGGPRQYSPSSRKGTHDASADDESLASSQFPRSQSPGSKAKVAEASVSAPQEDALSRHTNGSSADDESLVSSQRLGARLSRPNSKVIEAEVNMLDLEPHEDTLSRITRTHGASADDESKASTQGSRAQSLLCEAKVIEEESNSHVGGPLEYTPSGYTRANDGSSDDESKESSQRPLPRSTGSKTNEAEEEASMQVDVPPSHSACAIADDESNESSQRPLPGPTSSPATVTEGKTSMQVSPPQGDAPPQHTYVHEASADDGSNESSQRPRSRSTRSKAQPTKVITSRQINTPQEDPPSQHMRTHDASADDQSKVASQMPRSRSSRTKVKATKGEGSLYARDATSDDDSKASSQIVRARSSRAKPKKSTEEEADFRIADEEVIASTSKVRTRSTRSKAKAIEGEAIAIDYSAQMDSPSKHTRSHDVRNSPGASRTRSTRSSVKSLEEDADAQESIGFSPDGRRITVSRGQLDGSESISSIDSASVTSKRRRTARVISALPTVPERNSLSKFATEVTDPVRRSTRSRKKTVDEKEQGVPMKKRRTGKKDSDDDTDVKSTASRRSTRSSTRQGK